MQHRPHRPLHRTRPLALSLAFALGLLACSPARTVDEGDGPVAGATDPSDPDPAMNGTPDPEDSPEPQDPAATDADTTEAADPDAAPTPESEPGRAVATFGTGCFWCTEAAYEQLDGVLDAVSGYMGGHVDRPTYAQVCSKTTGHVEVVQVTYDPRVISYGTLLEWFWRMHDPTSWDRQGADAGPQYRSVIFTHGADQAREAAAAKAAVDASGAYDDPIVTEIREASTFWPAEEEHQDFYALNPRYGYCRAVIAPKLDKIGLDSGQ